MLNPPEVHPLVLFEQELNRAKLTETFDPTRCALATADSEGRPSVRFVLIKEINKTYGIGFFTNYQSRKARELDTNPHAAIAVHWESTGVQIRAEGHVTKMDAGQSDEYFKSRPRESQIGAWASPQSEPISHREDLEKRVQKFEQQFPTIVPRPPHWGGYWLYPKSLELWINGEARLHDRFIWLLIHSEFHVQRLAP